MATVLAKREGASVNLTTLTLSAHTGTHADAPYHFDDDGATLAVLDLAPYWGLAQVVTVHKETGPLEPADFAHVDLRKRRACWSIGGQRRRPCGLPHRHRLPQPCAGRLPG